MVGAPMLMPIDPTKLLPGSMIVSPGVMMPGNNNATNIASATGAPRPIGKTPTSGAPIPPAGIPATMIPPIMSNAASPFTQTMVKPAAPSAASSTIGVPGAATSPTGPVNRLPQAPPQSVQLEISQNGQHALRRYSFLQLLILQRSTSLHLTVPW
jgi:hypothetical protein